MFDNKRNVLIDGGTVHEYVILDQFFFLQNIMKLSLLNLVWSHNLSSKTLPFERLRGH